MEKITFEITKNIVDQIDKLVVIESISVPEDYNDFFFLKLKIKK